MSKHNLHFCRAQNSTWNRRGPGVGFCTDDLPQHIDCICVQVQGIKRAGHQTWIQVHTLQSFQGTTSDTGS